MEFGELLRTRRAVRKYRETPVTEEDVAAILEAVNLAPTAGNMQSFRVVVVRDDAQRAAIAEAAFGQGFATAAPVSLMFLADEARAAGRFQERGGLYSVQDATIAATHAWLALTDLGLGGCWIGAFDDAKMAAVVGAGEGLRAVAVITLGKPDDAGAQPKTRRGVNGLVSEGTAGGPAYGS